MGKELAGELQPFPRMGRRPIATTMAPSEALVQKVRFRAITSASAVAMGRWPMRGLRLYASGAWNSSSCRPATTYPACPFASSAAAVFRAYRPSCSWEISRIFIRILISSRIALRMTRSFAPVGAPWMRG